jgi:hypothetical protein
MLEFKIERQKYNNFLLFLVFYFILILCFAFVVRDEYAFKKANLVYEIDFLKLIISTALILVNTCIITFSRLKDFHYSITSLILIFFVYPSAIIFMYVKEIDYRIFLAHNLFYLIVLMVGKIRLKLKSQKFEIRLSKRMLLLIVLIGLIPFVLLFLPYLNLRNLLLEDIYETRALMDASINNLYTDYSYSWYNKFIIPCLLVFGIYFKDRFTIFISSLSLIFLYLCGAHKAVFVGLILTFVLYKYDYITKINYFLKILIVIGLFSLFVALVFNNDFFMTMSIRRALLLPAMIDVFYFDLFDNNHLLWSETFDGLLRKYPYELEHSYIIGDRYLGDATWGANNGIISDGFMNAGMLGIWINITIVSFYFSILNQLNISPRFFGLFFLLIFLIVSSSLSTVLLTHGGIILLLLAFFFMQNTNEQMR